MCQYWELSFLCFWALFTNRIKSINAYYEVDRFTSSNSAGIKMSNLGICMWVLKYIFTDVSNSHDTQFDLHFILLIVIDITQFRHLMYRYWKAKILDILVHFLVGSLYICTGCSCITSTTTKETNIHYTRSGSEQFGHCPQFICLPYVWLYSVLSNFVLQLKKKTAELNKACEKHYQLEQELAFYKIDSKFDSLGKSPSHYNTVSLSSNVAFYQLLFVLYLPIDMWNSSTTKPI